MAPAEPASSERLAAAVEARAAELGMTWQDIRAAGGPGVRTLNDLRHGKWLSLRPGTLWKLDSALRWKPGSSQAVLDGTRDPVPLPPAAPDAGGWRPEALLAGYSVEEIAKAQPLKDEIMRQFADLPAGTPPDQAGDALFRDHPDETALAAAWDAAWAASPEDPAARAEQVAWIVALRDVRRSAGRQGARGAFNPAGT